MVKNRFKKYLGVFLALIMSLSLYIPVPAKTGSFKLHMLDVGQGLSILMENDGHYAIYDGGGRSRSSFVVSYLQKHGVKNLDYVVASHFDEDHISGLVGALNVFGVSTVLCPDYEADTDIFASFDDAAEASGAEILHPEMGDSFDFAGAEIEVVGPVSYDEEKENDRSVAIKVSYGKTSFLMCGDTEEEAEGHLLDAGADLQADVLVVSHHGSNSSTSSKFLKAVNPPVALISCGKDNSYGHPGQKTLDRLREAGCEMYRTDRQGTVVCTSNGKKLKFDTDPCEDWTTNKKGEGTETQRTETETPVASSTGGSGAYVCNENSKKFHLESCESVAKMAEKNKRYATESREELIREGYSPCQNCNP